MAGLGNIANSGLQAAMAHMESISNNIANVNTPGFKKTYLNFAALQGSGGQAGLGVSVSSIMQDFATGMIQASDNPLDMSLNNSGFFIQRNLSSNLTTYSKAGNFQTDSNGYLMNAAGRLQGYGAVNGALTTSGTLVDLQIPSAQLPATPSTKTNLALNLDAAAVVPTGTFSNADPTTYNYRTDSTVYDSLGNPYSMAVYYIKQSDNTWNTEIQMNNTTIGTGSLTFTSDGALSASTGMSALSFSPTNGATTPQAIALNFTGSTQYASNSTEFTNTADGYPAGTPTGFYTIDKDGVINVFYSNNQSLISGQVAVANFIAPQGLSQTDNMCWVATNESGVPLISPQNSQGAISTGSIELSNVDLTSELVSLIDAQHDFQANAQVQQTYNQLLQTIENL